jgi:hypothetical protein
MTGSFKQAAPPSDITAPAADESAADEHPRERPGHVDPDSEIGEEDPGSAVDQPAVEPIYPPGTHGH